MKTFIPRTTTVNSDRMYFIDENTFIKIDTNVNRGKNELRILNELKGFKYIPQIIDSVEEESTHTIKMGFISGETLENCVSILNTEDKLKIIKDLTKIIQFLFEKNIVHGDINESNIIFNLYSKETYLIDFETGRIENSIFDLGGYRGLQYIINFMKL